MTNTVKKINMIDAVKLFFKNYFNFTGRASRSEFWWFYLAYLIVAVVIMIAEGLAKGVDYAGSGVASNLFTLTTLIGWLSLTARRLQDRGHSGWWQLANVIPQILFLIPYFDFLFSIMDGGPINTGAGIAASIFGIIAFGTGVTMIVFLCLPPKDDENKWGRNPLLPETSLTDQIPD